VTKLFQIVLIHLILLSGCASDRQEVAGESPSPEARSKLRLKPFVSLDRFTTTVDLTAFNDRAMKKTTLA